MPKTPLELGYYVPAEWEEHEGTWFSWPKNLLTFPKMMLPKVEATYCEMARALSAGEKVKILIEEHGMKERVSKMLESAGVRMKNIFLLRIKSADVWIRDYGPVFLLDKKTGKKAVVKWVFNAWGNKYDDLLYDNTAGEEITREAGVKVFRPGIVFEGGSIDVNGAGTALTTEQCLLNKNRNPHLRREEIEEYLREYLAVKHIVWLKSGIEGDDTDGHVDDFARFVSKKNILCAFSKNKDENAVVLKKNLEILESIASETGFEITRLPMPKPLFDKGENRYLPASYANFYIGNKAVLLPVFGDERDKEAVSLLRDCFPKREVVPIQARELVYGYGGVHCVTQQEPRGE
jgi:agmatine deiminase